MAVLALGISHRHAEVPLLERLAFADEDLVKAYRRTQDDPAIGGAVVLSTCNRVEIYGDVPSYHAGFQALKRLLCESRGVAPDDLAEPLYSHYEDDAAEHLFGVASGLDSMVLGEPQILSQVREAWRRADAEEAAGAPLGTLFQAAARTGRRVRSETSVGAAPDVFVSAGTDLAAEALGGLDGRHAVVVGAGQMSALAVEHVRRRGVATVRVLNRSLERARALAGRTHAEPGDLADLPDALAAADLVISATGAAGVVLTEELLRGATTERDRPLFVLDIAVPRDVDPAAGALHGVTLVDIDGLRASVAVRAAETATDIERAHEIVAEEVRRYAERRRAERLGPLFRALRDRGDAAVRAELERFRSDLAALEPEERKAVEALARGVVAKLLHEPMTRLRASDAQDAEARTLADLFGLELPPDGGLPLAGSLHEPPPPPGE
jgi:glutamyl-tRNA reductase